METSQAPAPQAHRQGPRPAHPGRARPPAFVRGVRQFPALPAGPSWFGRGPSGPPPLPRRGGPALPWCHDPTGSPARALLVLVVLTALVLTGCLPISTRHDAGPGMTTRMGHGSTVGCSTTVPRLGSRVDVALMDMTRGVMTSRAGYGPMPRTPVRNLPADARPDDAAQRPACCPRRSGDVPGREPRLPRARAGRPAARSARRHRSSYGRLRTGCGREHLARRGLGVVRSRRGEGHRAWHDGLGHPPPHPWPIRADLRPSGALRHRMYAELVVR